MEFTGIKDSGERQRFAEGAVRDTRVNKGRFDLLPPRCIKRLAQHYEHGATKYSDRNWELGQPSSRYMDSMLRHAFAYLDGQRDEDHLAAVLWNCMGIMYNEEYTPKWDDLTELTVARFNGDSDKVRELIEA